MARETWPPVSALLPAGLAEMTALISRRQRELERLIAGDITHTGVRPTQPDATAADPATGTEAPQ